MPKFRKKPVVVSAVQFTGNADSLIAFVRELDAADGTLKYHGDHVVIHTPEGDMRGDVGDWIIRGVKGGLYPCKPDIFEATYDAEPV